MSGAKLASFRGSLGIPAGLAAGFRLAILNRTGVSIVVAVNYKQG